MSSQIEPLFYIKFNKFIAALQLQESFQDLQKYWNSIHYQDLETKFRIFARALHSSISIRTVYQEWNKVFDTKVSMNTKINVRTVVNN